MFEIQSKIKRQVEILGFIINKPDGEGFSTFDLADMFGVEELTIKRDLKELRSQGIDIHSNGKHGVCIYNKLPADLIGQCIGYYTGIIDPASLSEKATSLLVDKRADTGLRNIVLLQHCIEKCRSAVIFYNKEGDDVTKKMIDPVMIYQSEKTWRLLARDGEIFKQFLLYKIEEVEVTTRTFPVIVPEEYEDLFRYAWKSWIGGEKYCVKLLVDAKWSEIMKARVFMHDQKFYDSGNGEFIFETTVNNLNEIAVWVVSLGKGVKVLEPAELRERVVGLAREVLGNYENM